MKKSLGGGGIILVGGQLNFGGWGQRVYSPEAKNNRNLISNTIKPPTPTHLEHLTSWVL